MIEKDKINEEFNPNDVDDMNSLDFSWSLKDYVLLDVLELAKEEHITFQQAYRQLVSLEEMIMESYYEDRDY